MQLSSTPYPPPQTPQTTKSKAEKIRELKTEIKEASLQLDDKSKRINLLTMELMKEKQGKIQSNKKRFIWEIDHFNPFTKVSG